MSFASALGILQQQGVKRSLSADSDEAQSAKKARPLKTVRFDDNAVQQAR